jgi:DNA-binding MarR family transcriptional regulator
MPVWKLLRKSDMRHIKLSGREATVVRAIGFTEPMMGAEIHDCTHMEVEDVTDTLNSLMSAGFVETVPYYDEVQIAEMPVTSFELNPAYVHELRQALYRR